MSDSVQPHRRPPTRLPHPWDSAGKNTGVGCHFLLQCMKVKSESEVAQSCPTLSDPMDCSLPGSSIHGIFQASIVEWGCHCLLQSMIEALNIYLLDLLVTFNCIFLIDTHFSCVPRNYSPGIPSFFFLPSQLLWPNKSFYTISQGWSF